jgi:hypothetical protein
MRGVLTKEEEEGKAAEAIPVEADKEEEDRNAPRGLALKATPRV